MAEEKKPTIDERLQAVAMNLELQSKEGEEQRKRIDKLLEISNRHEQEQERFRRIMRAAMSEFLNGENGDE